MPRSKRDNGGNKDSFADLFPPYPYGYHNEMQVMDVLTDPSEKVAEFTYRIRVLGAACDLYELEDSITRDTFICTR